MHTPAPAQPTSLKSEAIPAVITSTITSTVHNVDAKMALVAKIMGLSEIRSLAKDDLASVFKAILDTKP